jgi:hypothetical protein
MVFNPPAIRPAIVDRKPLSAQTFADIPAVLDYVRPDYGGHTHIGNLITDRTNGITYRVDSEPAYGTTGTLLNYILTPQQQQITISVKPTCKGDGVTDDSVALQAKINFAALLKARLYAPAGTYLSGDLVIPASLVIDGDGKANTIFKFKSGATYLISVNPGTGGTPNIADNIQGITISNMTLIGRVVEDGFAEHNHLLNLNAFTDFTMRNVDCIGWQGDGVYLGSSNAAGVERHNLRFRAYGCGFDGLTYNNRNAISGIDIDDFYTDAACTFTRCTRPGQPGAIDFEPDYQLGTDGKVFGVIRNINVNGTFTDIPYGTGVSFLLPPQDSLRVPATNLRVNANIKGAMTGVALFAVNGSTGQAPTDATIAHNYQFDGTLEDCGRPFALDGAKGATLKGTIKGQKAAAYHGYTAGLPCLDVTLDFNWLPPAASATTNALELRTFRGLKLRGSSTDAAGRFWQAKASGTSTANTGSKLDVDMRFASPTGRTTYVMSIESGYGMDHGSNKHGAGTVYEDAYSSDFIADGAPRSGPPTTGTWKLGARIRNNAPFISGTSPSRYYLSYWVCLTAGTPGVWQAEYANLDTPGAGPVSLNVYDTSKLPEAFQSGREISSVNGDANLPGPDKQGMLETLRPLNTTSGFDKFIVQTFTPANNNATALGSFWQRKGSGAGDNTWSGWQFYSVYTAPNPATTVVLPRTLVAIPANVDLASSAAYQNKFGSGLTWTIINGGVNAPSGTQGSLETFIDPTAGADGLGFGYQRFYTRGPVSSVYIRFPIDQLGNTGWGAWAKLATLADIPAPGAGTVNGNRAADWDNYVAWSDDAGLTNGTYQPPTQYLFAAKAKATRAVASGGSLTAKVRIATAGSGLTGAYVAVYRASDNARLAVSADQSTAWNAVTGVLSVTLTVGTAIALGDYLYLAVLVVGSTMPIFTAAGGSSIVNIASVHRGYTTGLSAMPATLPALGPNPQAPWIAVI